MLHRIVRTPWLGSFDSKSLAALRRNLSLALCVTGIMISTGVWMILLSQPAHATNCNGSCGADTGSCTGATVYCPTGPAGQCNQSACNGVSKSYANVVAQGTSNSPGVRTAGNTLCYTNYTCGFITTTNQTCVGWLTSTCSPMVGPSCTRCGYTGSSNFSYYACTYIGPCTEG
jgi:hypothetical protein